MKFVLFLSLSPLRDYIEKGVYREKYMERGISREWGSQVERYPGKTVYNERSTEYIGREVYIERSMQGEGYIRKAVYRECGIQRGVYREQWKLSQGIS